MPVTTAPQRILMTRVQIIEVDLDNSMVSYPRAVGRDEMNYGEIDIDLSVGVGANIIIPSVGETWYIRMLGSRWVLDRKLDIASALSGGTPIAPADGIPPSTSPTPTVQSGQGYMLATWVPISNVDPVTYEVHMSNTSGFTPVSSTKVGETAGTQFYIYHLANGGNLTIGETYYIKLVSKDVDGTGPPSAQASGHAMPLFSDGDPPVASPTPTLIAGPLYLNATWSPQSNPDPVTYEVYLSTASGFTPGSGNKVGETQATTFYLDHLTSGAALSAGTTYYVKLIARDIDGAAAAGTQASGVPTSSGATDGDAPSSSPDAIVESGFGFLNIHWALITNPDPVTYEVHISDTAGFTVSGATKLGETGTNQYFADHLPDATPLDAGTFYYVRIVAKDADGSAAPGTEGSGTPSELPPPSDGFPPASSPQPLLIGGPRYILARWPAVANADPVTYEIHVSTGNGFNPDSTTKVGETSATQFFNQYLQSGSQLAYGTTYYVRLIAKDADGAAAAGTQSAGASLSQIGGTDIANDAVSASQIATGAVGALEIGSGAVTAGAIAAGAVGTPALASAAVTALILAPNSVTPPAIAANAITAPALAIGAVTTPAILAGAITTATIATGAITTPTIATGAITAPTIAVDAVTAPAIAAQAIGSSELADLAVVNAKLAVGVVTLDKISAADRPRLGNLWTNSNAEASATLNWTTTGVTRVQPTDPIDGSYVFERTSDTTSALPDEFIPIDTSNPYLIAGSARRIGATVPLFYLGFAPYDKNQVFIDSGHVYAPDPTLMTLTAPANIGDVVLQVDTTTPVQAVGANRWAAMGALTDNSDLPNRSIYQIDSKTSTTLTLHTPLTVGYANGSKVRAQVSSGTYLYAAAGGVSLATTWTKYSAIVQGLNAVNEVTPTKFRVGTSFVKPVILFNYGTGGTKTTQFDAGTFEIATDTTRITDSAITTPKINAGAVTATQIATDTITATQIAAGAITASELAAGAVIAGKIAADSITAAEIAANAITASELAANSVIAGKISANAVIAGTIAAGVVTATELAANSVTAGKIAANAVIAGTIAAGVVTATELAANSVTAGKVAANAITAGTIAANAVTAGAIAANAVTAGTIAAGVVTAVELAANSVTAGKIAANAVTAGTVAAGVITANELAAGAVVAGKIAAGTITAIELAAGSVRADKLVIGNFDNLAEDPGFELGGTSFTWGDGWTVVIDGTNAHAGARLAKHTGSGSSVTDSIRMIGKADCKPGDEFYAEAWLKSTSGADGTATTRIAWLDTAGAPLSYTAGVNLTPTTAYTLVSVIGTAPAGCVFARLEVLASAHSTGNWYADDVYMKRRIITTFISDAAIVTAKIASAQITNALLDQASVNKIQVQSGSIVDLTAGKITAGTITTSGVYVGSSQLELSGATTQLIVRDTQVSPVNRVVIGQTGGTSTDYGIQIKDASGNLIVDVNGLGLSVVSDANIAVSANISGAKIASLSADKITAGTISSTVIVTGLISAPTADTGTAWRVVVGGATNPLKYWDGTTTKFSVDAAGNVVVVGLQATSAVISGAISSSVISSSSLDVGAGNASFHVDTAGKIWSGNVAFSSAPFSVDNAGNVVANNLTQLTQGAGSITTTAIHSTGTGSPTDKGFHVSSGGNMGLGGTSALGGKFAVEGQTGNVTSQGDFILVGTGRFATATSGKRIEMVASGSGFDRIKWVWSDSGPTQTTLIVGNGYIDVGGGDIRWGNVESRLRNSDGQLQLAKRGTAPGAVSGCVVMFFGDESNPPSGTPAQGVAFKFPNGTVKWLHP